MTINVHGLKEKSYKRETYSKGCELINQDRTDLKISIEILNRIREDIGNMNQNKEKLTEDAKSEK